MSNDVAKSLEEHFHSLLMSAVDDELSSAEQIEFKNLIVNNPEFKKEWEDYKKLKEDTQMLKFREPPDDVWDNYWRNVYNKIERGIGWIFFSIGMMIVLTYGIFKFIETIIKSHELVGIVKFGVIAIVAGLVILLVSVCREKLFTYKFDPYKEIQR